MWRFLVVKDKNLSLLEVGWSYQVYIFEDGNWIKTSVIFVTMNINAFDEYCLCMKENLQGMWMAKC